MRKRRLLVIAPTTTYRLHDFMAAARQLDVEVILASNRCHVLAKLWPEHLSISLPFSTPQKAVAQALEALHERPVDAVLPVDDDATLLAAMLARKLDLPGNHPGSTALTRNKFLFRREIAKSGLPSPRYWLFPVDAEPQKSVEQKRVHFPCVLKPLSLSGSRGVIRANDRNAFCDAFRRIAALLAQNDILQKNQRANRYILAETYIDGAEFAVEGLLTDGRLAILSIFDKPDPLEGPFFEETIYLTPSNLPRDMQAQVHRTVETACHLLGLQHGPVHAEVRITRNVIYLIELAPRTIGGLCARTFRFSMQTNLEELVIRHALGDTSTAHLSARHAAGVMMIPIPRGGILHRVTGLEAAAAVPGIQGIEITIEEGNLVVPLPEGKSYLGFIFARGRATRDVERSLRAAHHKLAFTIKPSLEIV